MANPDILSYIQTELRRGVNPDEIKQALRTSAWPDAEITDAFAALSQDTPASLAPQTPTINTLPGALETLKQAWELYRSRSKTLLGITAIPVVAMLILSGVILLASTTGGQGNATNILRISYGAVGIIVLIASIILQSVGQIALMYAMRESQAPISVGEAYRKGLALLVPLWWISALTTFIIFGGFILLIIPGILFSLWFSLSAFVLVNENVSGMDALLKSKAYVRGITGKILWRFIVIGIIALIVFMAIPAILSVMGNNQWAATILNAVVQFFFTPFMVAYWYVLYKNVRALKGDVAVVPSASQKMMFGAIAILGPVIGIILILLVILSIRNSIYNTIRSNPQLYPPGTQLPV